jgi:hypothetical protein
MQARLYDYGWIREKFIESISLVQTATPCLIDSLCSQHIMLIDIEQSNNFLSLIIQMSKCQVQRTSTHEMVGPVGILTTV